MVKNQVWQQAGMMTRAAENSLEMAWGFETLKPTPGMHFQQGHASKASTNTTTPGSQMPENMGTASFKSPQPFLLPFGLLPSVSPEHLTSFSGCTNSSRNSNTCFPLGYYFTVPFIFLYLILLPQESAEGCQPPLSLEQLLDLSIAQAPLNRIKGR